MVRLGVRGHVTPMPPSQKIDTAYDKRRPSNVENWGGGTN